MKANQALVDLGQELLRQHYRFITVTPETHRRVLKQNQPLETDRFMTDFFGWNRELEVSLISELFLNLIRAADLMVIEKSGCVRSRLRAATLDGQLFWHSGFPTTEANAVFFGPDSIRFVRFLKAMIQRAEHIIDLGCGSGVGGLVLSERVTKVSLVDINDEALKLAKANIEINGKNNITIIKSSFLQRVASGADWVIANPPFIIDDQKRVYRDGGGCFGCELSIQMARCAWDYLAPGGQLAMYTGAAIVHGEDQILNTLCRELPPTAICHYEELDPDIFGEELSHPNYFGVERIAAVGLILKKSF